MVTVRNNDAEFHKRVVERRNFLFGLWAGRTLGRYDHELARYASTRFREWVIHDSTFG